MNSRRAGIALLLALHVFPSSGSAQDEPEERNRILRSQYFGRADVVFGPARGLITLENIPCLEEILDVRDIRIFRGGDRIGTRQLTAALDSAEALPANGTVIKQWRNQARRMEPGPIHATIDTAAGIHCVELHQGGVGFLVRPDGLRGAFTYKMPPSDILSRGFEYRPQGAFSYGWGLNLVHKNVELPFLRFH